MVVGGARSVAKRRVMNKSPDTHDCNEQVRSFRHRRPAAAGAAGGVRGAIGHARRGATGRDAVGREPPAGQAARDRRRPAVRQVGARHRRHRARRGTGRACARAARRAAQLCRGRQLRPGQLRRHGDASPPTTCSATCCCRCCCAPRACVHRAWRCASFPRACPAPRCCATAIANWSSRRARPRPATSCKSACSRTATASTSTPASATRRAAWTTTWPASTAACTTRRGARSTSTSGSRRRATAGASPSPCRASPASAPSCAAAPRLATLPGLLRASLLRGLDDGAAALRVPADADVHGLAPAPPCRPDAPVAARRAAGGGGPGAGRGGAAAGAAEAGVTGAEQAALPALAAAGRHPLAALRRCQRPGPARARSRRCAAGPACCCCTAFRSWPTAGASRCRRWPRPASTCSRPTSAATAARTGWRGRLRRRPAPLRPVQPGARCARPGGRARPPRGGGGGRPRLRRAGGRLVRAAAPGRVPPRGADERTLRRPAAVAGRAARRRRTSMPSWPRLPRPRKHYQQHYGTRDANAEMWHCAAGRARLPARLLPHEERRLGGQPALRAAGLARRRAGEDARPTT